MTNDQRIDTIEEITRHRDWCAGHRMGMWCNCDRKRDEHDLEITEPGTTAKESSSTWV